MKRERVILSGAGGQGLMLMGKLFATLSVGRFLHITFIPSYGAEVRGGTSNCRIILSDEEIASPIVEEADSLILMNQPSADRFLPFLAKDGTAFINLSLVEFPRNIRNVVAVPATAWAQELGDIRVASMIMLGCYLGKKGFFTRQEMTQAIEEVFRGKGEAKMAELNRRAFLRGWDHIQELTARVQSATGEAAPRLARAPSRPPARLAVEVLRGGAMQKELHLPQTPFGPEYVLCLREPESGSVWGYVVVDNRTLGPSLGGVRLAPDITAQEVYGLASAMTFKNAAARLPIGGGKSGLLADPRYYAERPEEKAALITAFAEALWPFPEYIPGPDMGTNENDMQRIYDVFTHLNGKPHHGRGGIGRPHQYGGLPLDEWELTAHGLFAAIQTLQEYESDVRIQKARVVVQGFGNVGSPIARKLQEAGAVIVGASDINAALYHPEGLDTLKLEHARRRQNGLAEYTGPVQHRWTGVELDKLLEVPCDILIPAARPNAVTDRNRDAVQARVILQGANNPVPSDIEDYLRRKRGTICMTDFIVNAGGVICCAVELKMDTDAAFRQHVRQADGIGRAYMEKLVYRIVSENVREICERLRRDKGTGRSWRETALELAARRLREGPAATQDSLML